MWTWVDLDADSKLRVSYLVGGRDSDWGIAFMNDCASRINGRLQVTTDGHRVYLDAVEEAIGSDADFSQLQKVFGASAENETRYSPAVASDAI